MDSQARRARARAPVTCGPPSRARGCRPRERGRNARWLPQSRPDPTNPTHQPTNPTLDMPRSRTPSRPGDVLCIQPFSSLEQLESAFRSPVLPPIDSVGGCISGLADRLKAISGSVGRLKNLYASGLCFLEARCLDRCLDRSSVTCARAPRQADRPCPRSRR